MTPRTTTALSARPSDITLWDVYRRRDAADILHELLKERDETVSISHREMPSWDEHLEFIESYPYQYWYLIGNDRDVAVGSIYLSEQDEIGVFIFKSEQGKGYGPQAIRALMALHPRERFLANINPRNERSAAMFQKMGFVLCQHTYELRP